MLSLFFFLFFYWPISLSRYRWISQWIYLLFWCLVFFLFTGSGWWFHEGFLLKPTMWGLLYSETTTLLGLRLVESSIISPLYMWCNVVLLFASSRAYLFPFYFRYLVQLCLVCVFFCYVFHHSTSFCCHRSIALVMVVKVMVWFNFHSLLLILFLFRSIRVV